MMAHPSIHHILPSQQPTKSGLAWVLSLLQRLHQDLETWKESTRGSRRDFQVARWLKKPPLTTGSPVSHPDHAGSIPRLGRSPGGGNSHHSSFLAWRISRTQEPGGLQSGGSQSEVRRSTWAHAQHARAHAYAGPRPSFPSLFSIFWQGSSASICIAAKGYTLLA